MELVAKVEEEACGLARETAGVGESEMGSDQEIVDVVVVDLAGDCFVIAGRARVAEDGALVGGGPHKTEDSSVDRRVGCAKVMEGKVILGVGEHFCQVKRGGWCVADSNNRARSESGR